MVDKNNELRIIYSENDYIKKCNELNLEYKGNHKEHKKGTIIEFICNKHKDKGIQNSDWSHFKTAKKGCPYCTGRYRTTDEVAEILSNYHIELLSEFKGVDSRIDCKCVICDTIWNPVANDVIRGRRGCPTCGKEKRRLKRAKTQDKFEQDLQNVDHTLTVIGKYVNTHTLIQCRCSKCGRSFESYPANLLNKTAGCHWCGASVGEKLLYDALNALGISFLPEYGVKGCRYDKQLLFDAFNLKNNIAFEYMGQQHYYPVDFGGRGIEYATDEFEITKIRDKIKSDFCENNNISLICIPYWERNNMRNFITQELDNKGLGGFINQ